jgi:hypothetical protein
LYFVKNLNIYLPKYLAIAVLNFTECEEAVFVPYRRRGLHTITPILPTPDFDRYGQPLRYGHMPVAGNAGKCP